MADRDRSHGLGEGRTTLHLAGHWTGGCYVKLLSKGDSLRQPEPLQACFLVMKLNSIEYGLLEPDALVVSQVIGICACEPVQNKRAGSVLFFHRFVDALFFDTLSLEEQGGFMPTSCEKAGYVLLLRYSLGRTSTRCLIGDVCLYVCLPSLDILGPRTVGGGATVDVKVGDRKYTRTRGKTYRLYVVLWRVAEYKNRLDTSPDMPPPPGQALRPIAMKLLGVVVIAVAGLAVGLLRYITIVAPLPGTILADAGIQDRNTNLPAHRTVGGGTSREGGPADQTRRDTPQMGGPRLGAQETLGETLIGVTDRRAAEQLRDIRTRITSFEDMQLPENKRWAEGLLRALPSVQLRGTQAIVDPEKTHPHEPAYRSLYAVRGFGPRNPTRDSLHDHMRLLTSVRTTGDGNCHDRSTMISLTGREEGHLGLRLRNALYFIAYNDKVTGGGTARDFHILSEIAQPGTYLSDEATALTALTLRCPIAVVAPLGVQGAQQLCRLFLPPDPQPGAHVIIKAWTGITVRHPPIGELPNESGQALYHYCTALAPDTGHIERLLSHLTYHPLLKEQAAGRNRAVFEPTVIPPDQIDVDNPPPGVGPPARRAPTYAEVARRGNPDNVSEPTPSTATRATRRPAVGKKVQPAPRGQIKLDSWITRTTVKPKVPRPEKRSRHNNDQTPCPPPWGQEEDTREKQV